MISLWMSTQSLSPKCVYNIPIWNSLVANEETILSDSVLHGPSRSHTILNPQGASYTTTRADC